MKDLFKKRFLLFAALGIILLLLIWQIYPVLYPSPNLDHVQKNFNVSLPTERANCLYKINSQGWFGDGENYSVWQYEDAVELQNLLPWQAGKGFQQPLYQQITEQMKPEGYYLPRQLEQDCYYYLQEYDADGRDDDRLLCIYAPQVKLGDGLRYQNLLFVLECYT